MRRKGESGQALVLVAAALGIFLLGAVGLAVDVGQLYAHRQMAQNAADAAAEAGILSMFNGSNTGTNAFGTGDIFMRQRRPDDTLPVRTHEFVQHGIGHRTGGIPRGSRHIDTSDRQQGGPNHFHAAAGEKLGDRIRQRNRLYCQRPLASADRCAGPKGQRRRRRRIPHQRRAYDNYHGRPE